MGAGASTIQTDEHVDTKKKKKKDNSPAAIALREAMREGFRSVQLVEAVHGCTDEMKRKKRCELVAIEETEETEEAKIDEETLRAKAEVCRSCTYYDM